MIIVAINSGHDSSVAVADDYRILAAIQRERLTRIKGDSASISGTFPPELMSEALRIAGVDVSDVGQVVMTRDTFPIRCVKFSPLVKLTRIIKSRISRRDKHLRANIADQMFKRRTLDLKAVLRSEEFLAAYRLPPHLPLVDINHHYCHALSALFFTDWDDALVYTADGSGDNICYSMYHYKDSAITKLYGGDEELLNPSFDKANSVGLLYAAMTEALGYRRLRHEGKLTGLAAYGKPVLYDKINKHFAVREDGLVTAAFKNRRHMEKHIKTIAQSASPADAAASVQKFLEEIVLASMNIFLRRTGAKKVALAGGAFANVSLNRRIAELPNVEEVFIFPGMGDEGLAIGGIYGYLLRRDGMEKWAAQRHRLRDVYWGGEYDAAAQTLFEQKARRLEAGDEPPAKTAAKLLAEGKIVAIYQGRMEFGPRALGARSILASPVNAGINQTLNERLQRTEFMPFAPYVLEEDAADVFEVTGANRYAMNFMTITTMVKAHWREKIPAVVHIDGTARPQIIRAEDTPLYAAVLSAFKEMTGLPVLVNTSFNAHEEPIIYKPEECLKALEAGRVDYILLPGGVYGCRR